MSAFLEFTVLGCGSSGGVPRADGNWGACDRENPRNRRSRCSLLARRLGEGAMTTLLIDTSPDLARQTAAAGAKRLDAVLLTHDHADQTHGIDDIRAFAINQRARIPVYMDEPTLVTMQTRFGYIFESQTGYPAIADPLILPAFGEWFGISGPSGEIPILGFDQDHGLMRSVGFRLGDVAYSADVAHMPEESFALLQDLDVWIVDALRETPHPTHAHLERTLEWIARVKPRRAILTNMHIDLDYNRLRDKLPEGVEPAYDGLRFESAL